jgi:hypothetical protein
MDYKKKYLKYKCKYQRLKGKTRKPLNNGVWSDLPTELYVIGDIHGDFFALKQSLELTGCVEFDPYTDHLHYNQESKLYYLEDGCQFYSLDKKNIRWNPNKRNTTIVFAGDLIDRCRPHKKLNPECLNTVNDENCDYLILKLLFNLNKEANKYDSNIIVILGNHELLNLQDDLRYVSRKGISDKFRLDNLKNLIKENINNIYGLVRISNYVIVHGGINDIFFKKVNEIFNEKLVNMETIQIYNEYIRNYILHSISSELENETYTKISPFWDRTIGGFENLNTDQCLNIFTNNILNIKDNIDNLKIIVAHCPQFTVRKSIDVVNCEEFKGRIFRIDIGMSRTFDFYKSYEEVNDLLHKLELPNYREFYNYGLNDEVNRKASLLKINREKEEIITGKLSIDYFYETAFSNNRDKYLYLLSDLKKIVQDNIKDNELKILPPDLLLLLGSIIEKIDSIIKN